MRALSLWQPWASAIAYDLKRFETRGWAAPHSCIGKYLAVHAAKQKMDELDWELANRFDLTKDKIPFGAIVAVGRLVACHRTELLVDSLDKNELCWGNYLPGRFAWELAEVKRLPRPIPYRGAQGIFRLDELTSREVLAQLAEVQP